MRRTKYVAAIAAATVLSSGLFLPAADARVISGNDRGIVAESVDSQRSISLVVEKVATNPFDPVPAGEKPPAISGATFTLSEVKGIDVTTSAGRAAAKNMELDDARAQGLVRVVSQTTGDDGRAHFEGLKPGLYLLEEDEPDSAFNYHVSSPKLIILPLANLEGTSFTYENVVVTKWDKDKDVPPPSTTPVTTPRDTPPPENTPPHNPGTPSKETTPRVPNGPHEEPPTSEPPASSNGDSPLASTGANVLWAVGLGSMLVLLGAVLARRNGNKQTQ